MVSERSFRWKSTPAVDVDAYFLGNDRVYLFFILKKSSMQDEVIQDIKRFELQSGHTVMAWSAVLKTPQDSKALWHFPASEKFLWALEGNLQFKLETEQVLNPGLFLDQQRNREKLKALIEANPKLKEGKFLNLFSYTGSFTVWARAAGMRQTISIDVSKRYLNWEKENLERNFGNVEEHLAFAQDARVFLKNAHKKKNLFSGIILDPPTFSRSMGKIFQLRKEWPALVHACLKVLAPEGFLLASMNDQQEDQKNFESRLHEIAQDFQKIVQRGELPEPFQKIPRYPLKSMWIYDPEHLSF